MNKSEKIILIVVGVIAIALIIYFGFIHENKKIVYYNGKAGVDCSNVFVKDYKEFKKMLKNNGIEEEIINQADFSKANLEKRYNSEFFENNNLAIISVYEDTSCEYMYYISDIIYNEDKTAATIKYYYERGGYAGNLTKTWYTYMIVELEKTVTDIEFVKE